MRIPHKIKILWDPYQVNVQDQQVLPLRSKYLTLTFYILSWIPKDLVHVLTSYFDTTMYE